MNNIEELMERFKAVHPKMENMLRACYEQDGAEPVEIAIYLNILAGQHIERAVHEYMDMDHEKATHIKNEQVKMYSESGTFHSSTLTGEILGLNTVLGVKLMKMDHVIKQATAMKVYSNDDSY